jgi:argininosuccinate lyase
MPGYTHLQTAQPITFGHHLMAYVEMLGRDRGRFSDARTRMNESPLGAAALAGTSFPIDRHMTASQLGLMRRWPIRWMLYLPVILPWNIWRRRRLPQRTCHDLAEEIVFWSSDRFGFIRLSDAFSTGSSIMPQKRNPDAAELVRAKPGRITGALITMLTVVKGLPMTYCKDMQEDKEPVFDATDHLGIAIAVMEGMIRDMTVYPEVMAKALASGFATATDLADWIVAHLNVPFRDAHHITGQVVALAEQNNKRLDELTLEDLRSVHDGLTAETLAVLDPAVSVASRQSYGGTAPDQVKAAITAARKRFS